MSAAATVELDLDRVIAEQRREIHLALLHHYMERHEALRQKLMEHKRRWLRSVSDKSSNRAN